MVYITGDVHGDMNRFESAPVNKLKKGDTLIICGDFGFIWNGGRQETKALRRLGKKKYNICFVDGTHENFEKLNSYEVTKWNGGKVHNISGNLYHLMRGQIFDIEGMSFFTMGGGESPDIDIRFENNRWSKDEFPTREELLEGAENLETRNCKIDYVITHEPPVKIKSFLALKDGEEAVINGLNTYFEELSQTCEFKRWFFGSMHLDRFVSSAHVCVFRKLINPITGEIQY